MSPRTERLLERARALVAEPNNMDVRTRFLAATFNIDRLAAVLVEIDQSRSQGDADGSQVEPSTTGAGRHIPSTPPFIQWNGGENPAPGKRVRVRLFEGSEYDTDSGDVFWWHKGSKYDVEGYRIIPTDDQGGEGT